MYALTCICRAPADISSLDYFFFRYPDHEVAFVFTVVYMYLALVTLFVNLRLVRCISIGRRVAFGYVVFVVALIVTPLLEPAMDVSYML